MKPSLSPYQIKAFTYVARERSFSRAALRLGVTQSSVTQHVAKLEAKMGTQLFIRRREGLLLTRAGTELFKISDRLATLDQLIEEKISDYSSLNDGHIRLIANAPRPAMPIIAQYGELYPHVQIDFTLYDWTTSMALLNDRQVDVAIITEPEENEGLFIQELRQSRYMAYMRADHRLAKRKILSLKDLQSEILVMPEDGSLTQKITRSKIKEYGLSFSRVLKTTTFPMVKEAILHNLGVSILLEDSLFPSDRLVAIPLREMEAGYRDCLVIPQDKKDLRLIQSFYGACIEALVPVKPHHE